MDTILYLTDLHVGSHVVELSGVYDRAAAHRWRIIEIERERSRFSVAEHLAQWRPAGCIMECGGVLSENLVGPFAGTPVVYIDPDPKTARTARHTVSSDAEDIAATAVAELKRTERASYAFVGWSDPTAWSVDRGKAFAKNIRETTGKPCAVSDRPWDLGDTRGFQLRLENFLPGLPRPIGIFAVNDYVAVRTAEACRQLGLECPDDFTIVGVDNEEMHCESAEPTLTSIEQDYRGAGRLAADLLAELIADPRLPPRHLKFAPVRLVRRQSSRTFAARDGAIVRAVERIRREAVNGITAAEILAGIPVSRRLAEKRFFAATGRTILEEIQEVRLEHIMNLLATDLPIGHIAVRCGMQSGSYLKRFFKARTGMTLREWRNAHAR